MKVLIADDDAPTRFALKRLILHDLSASVTEVENGIDALDALSRRHYSFLLLDIRMPLMDGIETLQAIRSTPELVAFPVVVMTILRDEMQVRQMINLGISDYLAKPLKFGRVADCLTRLSRSLRHRETPIERAASGSMQLAESSTFVVVDGDAEFRHFFRNMFGHHYTVVVAESGAQALKICLESTPSALFIGGDTGVLAADALARKVRTLSELNGTRLIAVSPANLLNAVQQSAPFDAVLPRTFVPDVFRQNFYRLLGKRSPLQQILVGYPTMRANVISAAEQVFGMMLSVEVSLESEPYQPPGDEEMIATVGVSLPQDGLELEFNLRTPVSSARAMAARLVTGDPTAVSDADMRSVVSEVSNIITGRLQKGFTDRGIRASCSLPSAERVTMVGTRPQSSPEDCSTLSFKSACGLLFSIELHACSAAAAAA